MYPAELADGDRRGALIVLENLRKRHGEVVALDGLSLTIPGGGIFALLGPNGSGKTTTLKLLLGMARADSGTGTVFGLDIANERDSVAIRQRTGFVSETKELFQQLDVRSTIREVRSLYPRWDVALEKQLLQRFALPPTQKVSALSKGMRAKLALLAACCRGADLLVLDEPTDGLDPAAAEQMLETLVEMVAESGLTVLLSSHHLHEVERVADGVAIMRSGRVVLRGELEELRMRVRRVDVHHLARSGVTDEASSAVNPDERLARAIDAPPDGTDILRVVPDGARHSVWIRGEVQWLIDAVTADGAAASVQPVPLRELFLTMTAA